jgi:hypothetical protein
MIRLSLFAFLCLNAYAVAAPPNVVMIIGDDQAWTDYGFMGHPHIRTPHLDKLASQSLVFPRGYVPSSLCRASLATMITGLFPHQHLITSNDPPIPPGVAPPQLMKHEGYLADRTRMIAAFAGPPRLWKWQIDLRSRRRRQSSRSNAFLKIFRPRTSSLTFLRNLRRHWLSRPRQSRRRIDQKRRPAETVGFYQRSAC